jgi:hypothetical protein
MSQLSTRDPNWTKYSHGLRRADTVRASACVRAGPLPSSSSPRGDSSRCATCRCPSRDAVSRRPSASLLAGRRPDAHLLAGVTRTKMKLLAPKSISGRQRSGPRSRPIWSASTDPRWNSPYLGWMRAPRRWLLNGVHRFGFAWAHRHGFCVKYSSSTCWPLCGDFF